MNIKTDNLPKRIVNELSVGLFTDRVLRSLLTTDEAVALAQRLAIVKMLAQGVGYNQIRKELSVSGSTIASVKKKNRELIEAI